MDTTAMFVCEEVTSDSDFDELIPLLWHSYETPRISLLPLMFPVQENDPHGQEKAIQESQKLLVQAHHADPSGHWFKVTERKSGKIVGGCRWHVNETNPYEPGVKLENQVDAATDAPYEAPTYETGVNQKFASLVLGQILNPRAQRYVRPHTRKYFIQRDLPSRATDNPLDLHICFVHPDYRGKGIGRMLVDWGVRKADEMQAESFLEATDMGRPLYEKYGFVVVSSEGAETRRENPTGEWTALEEKFLPQTWHCMWRPIGGKFVDGETKLPW